MVEAIKISLREFIDGKVNENGYLDRMDIVVKHMAIRDVLNGDGIGLSFYRRMYYGVCGSSDSNINNRILSLRQMSNNICSGEFSTEKHPVLLTHAYNIWDGAHRIACACYCNQQFIFFKKTAREFKKGNVLGVDAFQRIFNDQEMGIIIDEQDKIFGRLGVCKQIRRL